MFTLERKKGKTYDQARAAAYDAVELRYGITSKTLQNYMTRYRTVMTKENSVFERENEDLANLLRATNDKISCKISEMQDMLSRNSRLLGLLEAIDESIHR